MANDIVGVNGDASAQQHQDSAEAKEQGTSRTGDSNINASTAYNKPDKPNWVEIGTLMVLILTFGAAIFAGAEAKRLADATEIAISESRDATAKQVKLTVESNQITYAAMFNASRAWLAPREIVFYRPPIQNETLQLTLNYYNVGKLPALNVSTPPLSSFRRDASVIFGHGVIPSSPAVVDAIGRNVTCNGLKVIAGAGGDAVFPYPDRPSRIIIDSVGIADEKLWVGNTTLIIKGCLGYLTFGQPHFSQFCYILRPEPPAPMGEWKFVTCPLGNEAN